MPDHCAGSPSLSAPTSTVARQSHEHRSRLPPLGGEERCNNTHYSVANGQRKVRAERTQHEEKPVTGLELLHRHREREDQADGASQGGGNGLLEKKAFRIIDEYPLVVIFVVA